MCESSIWSSYVRWILLCRRVELSPFWIALCVWGVQIGSGTDFSKYISWSFMSCGRPREFQLWSSVNISVTSFCSSTDVPLHDAGYKQRVNNRSIEESQRISWVTSWSPWVETVLWKTNFTERTHARDSWWRRSLWRWKSDLVSWASSCETPLSADMNLNSTSVCQDGSRLA